MSAVHQTAAPPRDMSTVAGDPEMLSEGDLVLKSIGFRAALADIYRTTRLAGRAASG